MQIKGYYTVYSPKKLSKYEFDGVNVTQETARLQAFKEAAYRLLEDEDLFLPAVDNALHSEDEPIFEMSGMRMQGSRAVYWEGVDVDGFEVGMTCYLDIENAF